MVLMTMLSTPSFWFGIILLIIFGVKIPIFPVGGVREGFINRLQDLFLPAVTLSLHMTAVLTRNLRDNIISILQSEHIVFAHAKGLQNRSIYTPCSTQRSHFRSDHCRSISELDGWWFGGDRDSICHTRHGIHDDPGNHGA